MTHTVKPILEKEISNIREAGLYKDERVILGPQGSSIRVGSGEVLNFCANNFVLILSRNSKSYMKTV